MNRKGLKRTPNGPAVPLGFPAVRAIARVQFDLVAPGELSKPGRQDEGKSDPHSHVITPVSESGARPQTTTRDSSPMARASG